MNIFKIYLGYRLLGTNYGLPVTFIEVGMGVNYTPEKLVEKLSRLGLGKESWVVLKGNAARERGVGVIVQVLKYIGIRLEVEDDSNSMAPSWLPEVDRWIVDWTETPKFTYDALRIRQDIILYKGEDIESFVRDSKKHQAIKAILVNNREEVYERIKGTGVRVYEV